MDVVAAYKEWREDLGFEPHNQKSFADLIMQEAFEAGAKAATNAKPEVEGCPI
jgi:hypothetical protein